MRFGSDWTGIFIRGDNAFGIATQLQHEGLREMAIQSLVDLLMSSNEHEVVKDVQMMREFDDCIDDGGNV